MSNFRVGIVALLATGFILLAGSAAEVESEFSYRWMYVSRTPRADSDVTEIASLAEKGSRSGLNGILLSAEYDPRETGTPEYRERLSRVKEACVSQGMELIPIFMSVGYNDGLNRNRNLAAGIPVKEALFVSQSGRAELRPDPEIELVNGGFEEGGEGILQGYSSPARLGEIASLDTEIYRGGKRSLRFEGFSSYPRESGFLKQTLKVHPNRVYVLSTWIRTEGMDAPRPFSLGHIRFEVRGVSDNRQLQFHDPQVPENTDWRNFSVGFNSWGYSEVEVAIGAGTGEGGRFWLDDVKVEEVGLANVLRRPGTPVQVRGEQSGTVYAEGRDYARIEDPKLNHRFDHEAPPIRLLPGGRIGDGERLRVSWYHSATVYQRQVSVCMSEPELYEIWREQVLFLKDTLAPKKYFLSMDEIRAGGSCAACKARGMTMGEILGDCLTRQFRMIREANPEAEVFTWTDMLDPTHNAGTQRSKYYYLVDGSFEGSWNHVPNELVMAIWGRRVRKASFEHFSSLGFRTLGAAYYDADELGDVNGWLQVLRSTPGAVGIMYTTWLNKYELLPEFGGMIARK